jgi:hypothetical protein
LYPRSGVFVTAVFENSDAEVVVGERDAKLRSGSIETEVDLPDAGIKGNSHTVMMDKNSDQVADLIQKWLLDKGLAQ